MANNYPVGTYKWQHAKRTEFDSSYYDSQFKDTPFWDTYQGILNQYAEGPEAQWLGFLGADQKNAYNHNQARSNALNALLEQMRTDEYNSPEQQAARERSAGLNPDITGVSDVGQTDSAATPNDKDMFYENPLPHIASFVQMLGSSALTVQQFLSEGATREGQELVNLGLAKDIILPFLNTYDPNGNLAKSYPKPSFDFAKFPFLSQRSQKKMQNYASNLFTTLEHHLSYSKGQESLEKSRYGRFLTMSSPGYSDNDEVMSKTASFIADELLNLQKLQMETDKFGYEAIKERKKIWQNSIKSERGFIKWLRSRADKGDVVATRLLLNMLGTDNVVDTGASSIGSSFISSVVPSVAKKALHVK